MPHVSVYVDESGDLGFKKNSSKFFTIGYVFTINRFPFIEKQIVKRTLKNINIGIKHHRRKISEFKFSNDSDRIRKKFLRKIKDMDIVIGVVSISKDSVREDLKGDTNFLYRYLVVDSIITVLVQEYFKAHDPYNSIKFIIDRSLSKIGRQEFNKYCDDKMSFRSWERDKKMESRVYVTHENSLNVQMLQVADYIAGAVQRKFEKNIPHYYSIISHKIKHKRKWDHYNKIEW